MDYDVIIIGAGMSGLAAGVRLAYFGKNVCILEKHYAYGGLNSYFRLDGRDFDVGLHALTNYVPKGTRNAPLTKLLRQLRLSHEDLKLCEQTVSTIRFPDRRLRFGNDLELLLNDVAEQFPRQIDPFHRFVETIRGYDDVALHVTPLSSRRILMEAFDDPVFIDMLRCPLMFYGCPDEDDMDFTQFATMFKSIFLEGFARPVEGVRHIIKTLVKRYRALGGTLKMRRGVRRLRIERNRVAAVELESGETLAAPAILSCAGYIETMRLCSQPPIDLPQEKPGRVSFMESIYILDVKPADLGHDDTITFFNTVDRFHYRVPDRLIDPRSGVICCPNNYQGHESLPEGILRFTTLANHDLWTRLSEEDYRHAKQTCREEVLDHATRYIPDARSRVVYVDTFTPRTIERFTGRLRGAVYGAPVKRRDGRTPIDNLFICGTDQGYLGVIGAMLSGVTIANLHLLAND